MCFIVLAVDGGVAFVGLVSTRDFVVVDLLVCFVV